MKHLLAVSTLLVAIGLARSLQPGSSVSAPSECSAEFSGQRNLKMSLSAVGHGGSVRKGEIKGLRARGDSVFFVVVVSRVLKKAFWLKTVGME